MSKKILIEISDIKSLDDNIRKYFTGSKSALYRSWRKRFAKIKSK